MLSLTLSGNGGIKINIDIFAIPCYIGIKMNNIKFRTRELSLATFLIAHGIEYLGVEVIAPQTYRFMFKDPQKCYELEKNFLVIKKQLLTEAKEQDYE